MAKMSALMEDEADWSEDSLPNTAVSEPGSSQGWEAGLAGLAWKWSDTHYMQATKKVASDIRRELYIFVWDQQYFKVWAIQPEYTAKLNLFYIFSSGNSSRTKGNFLFHFFLNFEKFSTV